MPLPLFRRRDLLATGIASMASAAQVRSPEEVQVELANIPPGGSKRIAQAGREFIVRRRTEQQISAIRKAPIPPRDPQADSERTQRPEWLVVDARCTHMSCPVQALSGDVTAFRCFCHGSRYDLSGRVLSGPAPRNLAVPYHRFLSSSAMIILAGINH